MFNRLHMLKKQKQTNGFDIVLCFHSMVEISTFHQCEKAVHWQTFICDSWIHYSELFWFGFYVRHEHFSFNISLLHETQSYLLPVYKQQVLRSAEVTKLNWAGWNKANKGTLRIKICGPTRLFAVYTPQICQSFKPGLHNLIKSTVRKVRLFFNIQLTCCTPAWPRKILTKQ